MYAEKQLTDEGGLTAAPARQPFIVGLSTLAMAVSVFPSLCLGVLAVFMVDDIGMSRTQLGVVAAVISAVTATTSIWLGGLADRRGGRLLLLVVFVAGAVGIAGYAAAPSYPVLVAAAVVAGVCQGAANPATNRLVSETIVPGRLGVVTGIKQSGEMMAVVACGAVLPAAAVAFGWRGALALAAVLPALAIVLVLVGVPARLPAPPSESRAQATGPVGWRTWWLAGYALLVGLVGASVMTYLALYAQESLGLD
ncbi:MAG: MFS transporter, partial [Chloroflexota bacterium]|nr:MFS transporter [Chloroflexota bacterium]